MFKRHVNEDCRSDSYVKLPDHLTDWNKNCKQVLFTRWSEASDDVRDLRERRVAQGSITLTALNKGIQKINGYEYPVVTGYLMHVSYNPIYQGNLPRNTPADWRQPEYAAEVYEFTTIAEAFAFLALFLTNKISYDVS